MSDAPIRVLFVCTHNSARSQIAEALLRHGGGSAFEVVSAGTEVTRVNPFAVRVLHERGIDWSGARSKSIEEFLAEPFDYVVTVCDNANETCPFFPGKVKRVHVGFEDPARLARTAKSEEEALGHYRRVRDEIRRFVESLPAGLESQE